MVHALNTVGQVSIKVMFVLSFSLVVSLPSISYQAWADEKDKFPVRVMTEEFPPYNYKADGRLQGVSVETLLHIVNQTRYSLSLDDIQLVPWARGARFTENKANHMLFSVARIKERERLFKWVGAIDEITIAIMALKDRNIILESLADVKKYRLGVTEDMAPLKILLAEGLDRSELIKVRQHEQNIKKLLNGRIDLFCYDVATNDYLMRKMDLDPSKVEVVYIVKKTALYYAFHKDTDDQLIEELNAALKKFKAEDKVTEKSQYDLILEKYVGISR